MYLCDLRSAFVDLVVVFEEYEVDSHIAVESSEFVNEFLLVDIVRNVNAVDKLEQCTEVCGLYSSELVEVCVLVEDRLEYALIVEVLRDSYFKSHMS